MKLRMIIFVVSLFLIAVPVNCCWKCLVSCCCCKECCDVGRKGHTFAVEKYVQGDKSLSQKIHAYRLSQPPAPSNRGQIEQLSMEVPIEVSPTSSSLHQQTSLSQNQRNVQQPNIVAVIVPSPPIVIQTERPSIPTPRLAFLQQDGAQLSVPDQHGSSLNNNEPSKSSGKIARLIPPTPRSTPGPDLQEEGGEPLSGAIVPQPLIQVQQETEDKDWDEFMRITGASVGNNLISWYKDHHNQKSKELNQIQTWIKDDLVKVPKTGATAKQLAITRSVQDLLGQEKKGLHVVSVSKSI